MGEEKRTPAAPEFERITQGLASPDRKCRARAVLVLCPCRAGWEPFEQHLDDLARLRKDPDPAVRARALHVFQDAAELQSEGYPTTPREADNEMVRTRRASRFPPDEDELAERCADRRARRRPRR